MHPLKLNSIRLLPFALLTLWAIALAGCAPAANSADTTNAAGSNTPPEAEQKGQARLPAGAVAAPEAPKGTGETPTEAELCKAAGIDPYKGAEDIVVSESKSDMGGDLRMEYTFKTADSVETVVKFYEGYGLMAMKDANGTNLMGKTKSGNDIIVATKAEDGKTVAVVKAIVYTKKDKKP